jgi:hypothetical protein
MARATYPTAMPKFRRLIDAGKTASDFGFALPNEHTFRFCQRFRVSKSFEGVKLTGYSTSTVGGYSALFKILLTWSAFESFLKLIDRRQDACGTLLAPYDPEGRIHRIRGIDHKEKFYLFLSGQVNPTHKQELVRYFNNRPFNITYLASAVRHIFAHGSLTAHPNHAQPATIKQISNVLCDFLLHVLDSEFTKHVDAA